MGNIVADWVFGLEHIKSGTIGNGDLVIGDNSNNGNELELVTYGYSKQLVYNEVLNWSEESYFGNGSSLQFKNNIISGIGQYFKTVDNAPINTMTFENGFTIEVIVKIPNGKYDPWMGILTRSGSGADIEKNNGEKELLSTLSYNDMFQWTSHPTNLDYNPTNWSIGDSKSIKGKFLYVTIVNNGQKTLLYLNGVTDIRNPKEKIVGIDFVDGKGWLIGAAQWDNKISGLFSGKLERIRICNEALDKDKWLVQTPEPIINLVGTHEKLSILNNKDNYNFIFIPDSQYMCESAPEMVHEMTKWIRDNENNLNIKFVGHVGDITEESTDKQYMLGVKAFKELDEINLPYLVTPGNHDMRDKGKNFNKYFGVDRYKNNNQICNGALNNSSVYTIVEAGSYRYLVISLDYSKVESSVQWAQQAINNNKDLPTIVITHDAYNQVNNTFVRTKNGKYIWNNLVNSNNQIFMVVAGHQFAVSHKISANNYGREVIEMLVNYQVYPSGGNGWIRLIEFDEEKGTISCNTYSPWIDKIPKENRSCYDYVFLTSEIDKFTVNIDFDKRFLLR